jgi:hypothetical protein
MMIQTKFAALSVFIKVEWKGFLTLNPTPNCIPGRRYNVVIILTVGGTPVTSPHWICAKRLKRNIAGV